MGNGIKLPPWAQEMADLFRSGSVCQFLLHGNIFDLVPAPAGGACRMLPLQAFLEEVMFQGYHVVLRYDRGKGIRATVGADDWGAFLEQNGLDPRTEQIREPGKALELIDRYLLRSLNRQAIAAMKGDTLLFGSGSGRTPPNHANPCTTASGSPSTAEKKNVSRIAVVIDFAEFVVPRGEALQLGGEFSANVVKVLGWANDPAIIQSNIVTVLLAEGLHDLNDLVAENPHAAKLRIPLPDENEMLEFIQSLAGTRVANVAPYGQAANHSEAKIRMDIAATAAGRFGDLQSHCQMPIETLARRLTGLSRVGAQTAISLAVNNGRDITDAYLARTKKDLIERQCQGLLEFMESPYTLDNVAGQDAVKAWLREDATLLRRMALRALPMGYLITGRIGTGKTFVVQCWAGELGIPCVVFKNFRDRWVGATESNLEKIFAILHALGQVLVFIDEADQAAGKRDGGEGDSGLSGRVYAMLAKEMSDTRNRGKIIWVLATSRPDLLEADLKRQGRLDVHIPLFGPRTQQEMRQLLLAVAGKLGLPLSEQDLPDLPPGMILDGNELEGVLVRALRQYELGGTAEGSTAFPGCEKQAVRSALPPAQPGKAVLPSPLPSPLKAIIADVLKDIQPSPLSRKLEYMDMVAVRECTDKRFLVPPFDKMTPEQIEQRIDELKAFM
jgi:hypothetical protein